MSLAEIRDEVFEHLKQNYNKRGCDFYFRAKHLQLPYNNYQLGRACIPLRKEGVIEVYSTSHSCVLYRTCFNGGDKGVETKATG